MDDLLSWVKSTFGHVPSDPALFELALTHSSRGESNYERLEFLGDRVLGVAIAAWLYDTFPDEPEGKLSRRLNVLVSRATCAEIAREIGIPGRMRLGKQAREDGAQDSDNVLGDAAEALIGAIFLDGGFEPAIAAVRHLWASRIEEQDKAPKHPKSALQEWAAANDRRPPVYELIGRSGTPHLPKFQVEVSIRGIGSARGSGTSKQEAETEAATALLEQVE